LLRFSPLLPSAEQWFFPPQQLWFLLEGSIFGGWSPVLLLCLR
jgi:hypothetical protein